MITHRRHALHLNRHRHRHCVFDRHSTHRCLRSVTGLGQEQVAEEPKPTKVVDNTANVRSPETQGDFRQRERQAAGVRQVAAGNTARKLDAGIGQDMDYLDIPAFLRRQAD